MYVDMSWLNCLAKLGTKCETISKYSIIIIKGAKIGD